MRLNGIGIAPLGVEPKLPDGTFWATTWFTFIYLPIVPLWRRRLRRVEDAEDAEDWELEEIEDGKFNWTSIFKTLGFSWIFVPLVVGGPLSILVKEVWDDLLGWPSQHHGLAFGLGMLWLAAWVLGLHSWHAKRFQP